MLDIVSYLGAFGLGGVIATAVSSYFQRRNEVKRNEHELKSKRYQCALMLMWANLEPVYLDMVIKTNRPELVGNGALEAELRAELIYSLLFATDDIVRSMNAFIEKPGVRAIVSVALNMRRDLWDRRSKLDESDLTALGDTIYAYDDQ